MGNTNSLYIPLTQTASRVSHSARLHIMALDLAAILPVLVLCLPVLYFVGRYIDVTYIRPPSKTGFGRGAPGFQTSVRIIAVPRAVQPEGPKIVKTKDGGVYSEEWIPQQHFKKQKSASSVSSSSKKRK